MRKLFTFITWIGDKPDPNCFLLKAEGRIYHGEYDWTLKE